MTSAAALSGRRVLELADEKGLYCGKLLADMGADVIKIERPGGDPTRNIPPFWGDTPHPERGLFFLYTNTSKRAVTLDVTTAEGQALFRRLAQTADLVIETFEPGTMDGWGIGYQALNENNPGLVFTSITGFGQTGPHKAFKSSDLVANALAGGMYVTGVPEDPPVVLVGSQAHIMASTCAAVSSMIALFHSTLRGEGQQVDISVEEVNLAVTHIAGVGRWLEDRLIPKRIGSALIAAVPSGAYPCKDGLVYLIVNRPLHWKALAQWIYEVTGNDIVLDPMFEGPTANRQPVRDLLDVYISDLTARFTVDEMYHEGQRRHLAVTPVNTATGVVQDPHLAARNYFVAVDHPGVGTLRYPGAPYRHAGTPWAITRPAPRVGQHNEEIFCGELGLSTETVGELRQRGII
ncbi:MAG: putative acyl-CoA transferase/carnitine dehydratase [Deltaproteobacteria bacterium]|nr:putative acyl-CoA transferase/carnitine dehydratase [Deltaproteobacteria bacterium]